MRVIRTRPAVRPAAGHPRTAHTSLAGAQGADLLLAGSAELNQSKKKLTNLILFHKNGILTVDAKSNLVL